MPGPREGFLVEPASAYKKSLGDWLETLEDKLESKNLPSFLYTDKSLPQDARRVRQSAWRILYDEAQDEAEPDHPARRRLFFVGKSREGETIAPTPWDDEVDDDIYVPEDRGKRQEGHEAQPNGYALELTIDEDGEVSIKRIGRLFVRP